MTRSLRPLWKHPIEITMRLSLVLALVFHHVVGEGTPWWSNAVYYRILVDSFRDADGDGLGDLTGLIKQVSYVRAIGADAVILSPLLARSEDCNKPGILEHNTIDERYGNIELFNTFMEKTKKLELRVVITIPLQSVSTSSEWFISSADRISGFEDRIVWKEGNADEMPSVENNTTWVWHETRKAYYATINKEAVLNLCSENLAAALSSAQCNWLRKGVAGVLLNPDFADQRCGEKLLIKLTADARSCARGGGLNAPVILVETSFKPESAARYYGEGGVGANSIISGALTSDTRSASELAIAVYSSMLTAPQESTPAWQTSAPNKNRITTRYGSEMTDAINLFSLMLPGPAIIHQGDEIGSADTILEWATSDKCWPTRGYPSAAPFPWDDTANAGFTTGDPWLPLPPNFRYANAKTEFANDFSHVGVVKLAAAMRKSPAMGPHVEIKRINGALAILRWGGTGSLLVVSNIAKDQTEVQLSSIPGLPTEMTVASSSGGSRLTISSHVSVDKVLKLGPGETVLFVGGPRHCGGPGPVDKITSKISEGWQKINKYFGNI